MFKLPGTAKIKAIFTAILWAIIACILPDAASAELDRRAVNEPNEPNRTPACDAILFYGDAAWDAACLLDLVDEFATIAAAAIRNEIAGDDLYILLVIRKAENGRPGREFGVIHPKCNKQMQKRPDKTLDIQAGWAAATIVKNRVRWSLAGKPNPSASAADGFINFLADRYVPKSADPAGNRHWKINVAYWYDKIKGQING